MLALLLLPVETLITHWLMDKKAAIGTVHTAVNQGDIVEEEEAVEEKAE